MISMKQLILITLVSGALCSQPNIIVIIADDMGWNDVGFHGSNQVPTPNIDALAYNGIILNHHYTMPTCTPSRTAYLTAKYPIRTGMQGSPILAGEPRGIPLSETLLPQRMRDLGYVTRLVGKWHVGTHRAAYTPTRRGFDSHLGYLNGYIGYFDHSLTQNTGVMNMTGYDFNENLVPAWQLKGQYATDVFTREAVRVILEHDMSRPLYLHLAHLAVHSGNLSHPLEVPDIEATSKRFSYIQDPDRRLYAGMLTTLDDSVGMVVSALAEKGILNNSIILFMADNGAPTVGIYSNTGSNWPLRGIKATQFEGGVRGVCSLWSPWFQNPGTVSSQLVHISDWLPTFYTAAGGNISDLGEIDGIDQWSSFLGQRPNTSPRNQILINIDDEYGVESIIRDNWKLIRMAPGGDVYSQHYGESGRDANYPEYDVRRVLLSPAASSLASITNLSLDGPAVLNLRSAASETSCPQTTDANPCKSTCLFDLALDPCEIDNVAAIHQDVVEALGSRIDNYRSVMLPQLNKPVDLRCDPANYNNLWVPWLDYIYDTNASTITTISINICAAVFSLLVLCNF